LTFVDRVPAVTEVPNTYAVPLTTPSAKALPVLAAKVDDTVGLTAVIVALNGPVDAEQDVAARLPAVPPKPFTVKAIVGLVPPQFAASVTATEMLLLLT